MCVIQKALSNLDRSIDRLEDFLAGLQNQLTGKQRDMFAAPLASAQSSNFSVDNSVIAERLDQAIKKVEELLEG